MVELTARRREALCLVALTNREIGMRLDISWRTVRNHITDIRKALGLDAVDHKSVRLRLLMLALQRGIVTVDEIELPPPPGWCWERVEQARAARWREKKK